MASAFNRSGRAVGNRYGHVADEQNQILLRGVDRGRLETGVDVIEANGFSAHRERSENGILSERVKRNRGE